METSSNFYFNLPQSYDKVDISKLTDNWKKIDSELRTIKTRGEENELFTGSKALLTTDNTETIVGAINEVDSHADTNTSNIASEITRATKAEETNATAISTETARATKAENTLSDGISAETTRAKNAESANATSISNEVTRAKNAESTITDSVTAEVTRAKAAEQTNASAITTEATRAKKAEESNTANIVNEVNRAKGVEGTRVTGTYIKATNTLAQNDTALDSQVKANADAIATLNGTGTGSVSKQVSDGIAKIVANAPEDFDTLKELSDWIATHSSDASAMNTQISANKANISTLTANLGGHTIKSDVPSGAKFTDTVYDDTALAAKVTANANDISAEITRAKNAESANATSISNINSKISNIDNTADKDKPISTATQTALDKKQDAISDLEAIRTNASSAKTASEENASAIASIKDSELLNGIETYYALRRTGIQYSVQVPKFEVNQSSTCTKVGANANLNYTPSTDTDEGVDDYENIPLFQWVHVVYKRYSDGAPYPVAIEGTKEYDELVATGACDVGAMQMSFYVKFDSTSTDYDVITISDLPFDGATIWSECKRADGSILPWCIGSSYYSSKGDDGLLHSLPNRAPERFQSYNNMCDNYPKKGKGYQGAGCERTTFSYIFMTIKGATKNIQTLFQGCTNYNFQYTCAVAETNVKRVIMTTSQGGNFYVGASVSIGVNGSNNDRGQSSTYSVTPNAVILSKESVTINDTEYTAINLDLDSPITTTTSTLVSSIHWRSGSTDKVFAHRDGSYVSNTDAKHPFRIQGREYRVGGWDVASDTMFWLTSTGRDIYVYPKGVTHVKGSNTNAVKVGTMPFTTDSWIGDISFDVNTGVYWFTTKGKDSGTGIGDYFYVGGTSTSTLREYLVGGRLGGGSDAGLYLNAWHGLGEAYWACLGAD